MVQLIASFLILLPLILANPFDHELEHRSSIHARNNQGSVHIERRHEYLDSSGATPQNNPALPSNVTVPINDIASSNSTLSLVIRMPYTSEVATAWSKGGGDGQTISDGYFKGRISGRGTRDTIYGTARYGSGYGTYNSNPSGGYTYAPSYELNVAERNFMHGFPPIRWWDYGGSLEYENAAETDLPGIAPPPVHFSTILDQGQDRVKGGFFAKKNNQTWFICADGMTADFLNTVLQLSVEQGGCAIEQTNVYPIDLQVPVHNASRPEQDNSPSLYSLDVVPFRQYNIYPWNVIQYYRGSSVLLANQTYDNALSHNNNTSTDYWGSSPLNTTGVDMDFLNCLNHTIAAAIPIVDPTLIIHNRMTPRQLAGIVVGSVVGSIGGVGLLAFAVWFLRRQRQKKKEHTRVIASRSRTLLGKGSGTGEMPDTDSSLDEGHALAERPSRNNTQQ